MSLLRIWAVTQKGFIQLFRDRRTLAMMLALPIIQLLLFGYAIDMNVDHVPTIVADQSQDAESRAYIEAVAASGFFDIVGYVSSSEEVAQAIDRGDVIAGIFIPPDFAAHLKRGDAQVSFLVDGSDVITAQSAYAAADVIAQNYAGKLQLEKIKRMGAALQTQPIDARVRILYNPNMTNIWFTIPGMCAMILQTQSLVLTTTALVLEREAGTIEQLLVTPIRPVELMLGKIIPNLIITLVNMLSILGMGILVFGVPFQGSFQLFFWLSVIFSFSGLGLGLLVSSISETQKQAQQIIMAVMLVAIVLGGFMFPRTTMPDALKLIGDLFPLTHFIPIARGIITKGVGLDMLWEQVTALVVYVAVILLISVRSFKQGLE
ncbi:MAG: ABC transporter permease [Anaerolineae bacterium]|jgi:ABC-2 type transport system permease protein|nr:ABC transporter permease [Anaerolineae bacterium]